MSFPNSHIFKNSVAIPRWVNINNRAMACAEEVALTEIVRYKCGAAHKKDLMALLCKDCERAVCLDCLNNDHAGHKMCKLSECIDDKIDQLNNVVQKNNFACFDLKEIRENLQKRRQQVKKQVEEMVQRVTARKEEMVKEVKDVGQKTIKQITNLATDFENSMERDEHVLNSFMSRNLFRKDNEDCIKCFYFNSELEMLGQKYGSGDQNGVPFTLVLRAFPTDKIFELVCSIVTDEQSSSDENLEQNCDTPTNPNDTNNVCKSDIELNQYKKKFTDGSIDSILFIAVDRSIFCSDSVLYHQSNTDVKKLVDKIGHFTYVPETGDIIVMLKGENQIYRKHISTTEPDFLLYTTVLELGEVICMGHDATAYLVLFFTICFPGIIFYIISTIDDQGVIKKIIEFTSDSSDVKKGRYKLHKSSFVIIGTHVVHVTKGLHIDILFSYSGIKGNSIFCPADTCTDSNSNYLVVDSYDDTVHLLDPKGKFLRILMSAEDGPRGIRCIDMNIDEYLRIGCQDGMVHVMNYQHFKSTTRKERCLQKLEDMKTAGSLKTKKTDNIKLKDPNTDQLTEN